MCFKEEESEHSAEEETPYHEQIDAFTIELDNLITRYRNEFDLHLETLIGALEMAKTVLLQPMEIDLGSEMLDEDDSIDID
tara:strand:- start:1549 stop:1791 length:243 start_codon:yes stop_codon:yes gene_type:complete